MDRNIPSSIVQYDCWLVISDHQIAFFVRPIVAGNSGAENLKVTTSLESESEQESALPQYRIVASVVLSAEGKPPQCRARSATERSLPGGITR